MFAFLPFFSIHLLILILLGFWGKSIAERKGYSGFFGFLVAFFGEILGILLLAVLPYSSSRKSTKKDIKAIRILRQNSDYKPDEYANVESTAYFCPHCFQEVKVYEGYNLYECPHCNGKFTL